jgi:hypothetical protein
LPGVSRHVRIAHRFTSLIPAAQACIEWIEVQTSQLMWLIYIFDKKGKNGGEWCGVCGKRGQTDWKTVLAKIVELEKSESSEEPRDWKDIFIFVLFRFVLLFYLLTYLLILLFLFYFSYFTLLVLHVTITLLYSLFDFNIIVFIFECTNILTPARRACLQVQKTYVTPELRKSTCAKSYTTS